MIKKIFKYKVKILLFAAMAIFMFCLWSFYIWQEDILVLLKETGSYLRQNLAQINNFPLFFYALGIFLLPIFFLPVTPIYFLASARAADSETFMIVLAYCYLGVAANMVFSYFLSRKFGKYLRVKLGKRGINIPEIPRYEQYEFTFLMRMIPGNPLVVQNYVLGLANVPFDRYILVSIPLQFMQVAAYVYFGEGVFEGGASKIIMGLSVLSVLGICAMMLNKAYGRKFKQQLSSNAKNVEKISK